MNFLTFAETIVLGIVEGITEFLPISSTFHLIFASKMMGISETELLKVFHIFIQSGAILAVMLLYWKEIITNQSLIKNILLSFIPTAVIGLLLHSVIKNYFFEDTLLMLGAFIGVGIIFIVFEKWYPKNSKQEKTLSQIHWKEAVIVGLGQALAILPGISRSGAVILTLLALRVRRDEAAKYSFLLGIPTIVAAGILDVFSFPRFDALTAQEYSIFAIGFFTAFLSSLFTLKWFIRYLQSHTFVIFGWYRILIGIFVLLPALLFLAQ